MSLVPCNGISTVSSYASAARMQNEMMHHNNNPWTPATNNFYDQITSEYNRLTDLADAPASSSSSDEDLVSKPLREKNSGRKRNGSKYTHVPHRDKPPQIVAKRNARERRRVQAVNSAFVRLRKAVPFENHRGKRVSKVKTLQYAIEYIKNLEELLQKDGYYATIDLIPSYYYSYNLQNNDFVMDQTDFDDDIY